MKRLCLLFALGAGFAQGKEQMPPNTTSQLISHRAAAARLGLSELRDILLAGQKLVDEMNVGEAWLLRGKNPIRVVTLTYQGQEVTQVTMSEGGQLQPLGASLDLLGLAAPEERWERGSKGGKDGPDKDKPPSTVRAEKIALSRNQWATLRQDLAELKISGAVQLTPRHYRLLLLHAGQPVGMLQLEREGLRLSQPPRMWPRSRQ